MNLNLIYFIFYFIFNIIAQDLFKSYFVDEGVKIDNIKRWPDLFGEIII
jgi:hypothetical protein